MATRTRHRRQSVGLGHALEAFARRVTEWAGSSWAFGGAVGVIVVWALLGPFYSFSDTWQLVVNTGTTIVTCLMVFLIQRSQNKDSLALHLKLNEIVAALEGASNRLINVEELTEDEVRTLHQHYQKLVEIAQREDNLTRSHSIEEAEVRHRVKKRREQQWAGLSGVSGARPPDSKPSGRSGGAR
jgi:low affinity Fe/Cu permease